MKLIDLLVQELPKRSGWPEGSEFAASYAGDKYVWFFKMDKYPHPSYPAIETSELSEVGTTIKREQYEAALAASKQPVWNGDGLPPLGCECELVNFFGNDFPEFVGEPGEVVKIIGNGFANGSAVAFYESDGGRGGVLAYAVEQCFRPVRTEAERKREETVDEIVQFYIDYHSYPKGAEEYIRVATALYDAIAAGKIRGVKLDLNNEA